MKHHLKPNYDVVIAGGGLVGASLALSLAGLGKTILVVEATEPDSSKQVSFDERTVALTYSSRLIFEQVGIWSTLENLGVTLITNIHISDRGQAGMTHLNAEMVGTEALGYVVPTRSIGHALWQKLTQHEDIDVICPASISQVEEVLGEGVKIKIQTEQLTDNTLQTYSEIMVLADGGRSNLSDQLGIETVEKRYNNQAIVFFIETNKAHNGRAYERFTEEGPIALLPHKNKHFACAWTSDNTHVATRMALGDEAFLAELQQHFGFRAGRFISCSQRHAYPLALTEMSSISTQNCVLVGNAAHKVHPVAGQGFNLGLRDVALLSHLLKSHWNNDNKTNLSEVIQTYSVAREKEAKHVKWFTHGLIETFSHQSLPVKCMRSALLQSIEMMPFIKRKLLKRTMGLSPRNRILYANNS